MAVQHGTAAPDFDAIIIGAGMSGLFQLHRLRGLGMKVRVFEAGTGVGGTWYWNRYPGARFDSESYSYGYSFSKELLEEWDWSEHFAPQPETLRYLNHVADKFDLRRDIQFNARVTAAYWQEGPRRWDVTLEDGSRHSARWLITAIGPLSAPTPPDIEGVDSFRGLSYHTARWPKEPVSFEWTDPAHINRIREVLSAQPKGTLADSMALQTDSHDVLSRRAIALLKPLTSPDPSTARALELLKAWDNDETTDSAAAAVYLVWTTSHLGQAVVKAAIEARSARSSRATRTWELPVPAVISAATFLPASVLRTARVTSAPPLASVRAVSTPMPEAPPVTMMRLPLRSSPAATSSAVVANPNGVVMRSIIILC